MGSPAPPQPTRISKRRAPDHFFERQDQLIRSLPKMRDSATGFLDLIRLRHRYNAIIGQNCEILRASPRP